MKESFGYENHTDELKKNLTVGAAVVGSVGKKIYEQNEVLIHMAYTESMIQIRRKLHSLLLNRRK